MATCTGMPSAVACVDTELATASEPARVLTSTLVRTSTATPAGRVPAAATSTPDHRDSDRKGQVEDVFHPLEQRHATAQIRTLPGKDRRGREARNPQGGREDMERAGQQ